MWSLSPDIHKIHTDISPAGVGGWISQRPWRFSAAPVWCPRPPLTVRLAWTKASTFLQHQLFTTPPFTTAKRECECVLSSRTPVWCKLGCYSNTPALLASSTDKNRFSLLNMYKCIKEAAQMRRLPSRLWSLSSQTMRLVPCELNAHH